MNKEEAQKLKDTIDDGYHSRKDYPPYALASWDDRNRYREYVFKIIDEFVPSRRLWRALVRVVKVNTEGGETFLDVVLPGWNVDEVIRLSMDFVPIDHRHLIQPDFRFYAMVNKGAETREELYFRDFELGDSDSAEKEK